MVMVDYLLWILWNIVSSMDRVWEISNIGLKFGWVMNRAMKQIAIRKGFAWWFFRLFCGILKFSMIGSKGPSQ